MKKLIIIALIAISAGSCTPAKKVGTGYLVTVEEGIKMQWDKVETSAEADQFILKKTGLTVCTDSIIGENPPYWDMTSGRKYIYVEKKAVYQRRPGGRKIYRYF
jgi:ABC-type proline/glycine betaine transport system substrate-binding protein